MENLQAQEGRKGTKEFRKTDQQGENISTSSPFPREYSWGREEPIIIFVLFNWRTIYKQLSALILRVLLDKVLHMYKPICSSPQIKREHYQHPRRVPNSLPSEHRNFHYSDSSHHRLVSLCLNFTYMELYSIYSLVTLKKKLSLWDSSM